MVNGVNPNFTINKGPGNLSMNPTPALNGYNFKQKETQNPTGPKTSQETPTLSVGSAPANVLIFNVDE